MANLAPYRKNDRENIAGFNRPNQKRKVRGVRRKSTERDIISNGLSDQEEDEEILTESGNAEPVTEAANAQ